MYQEDQYYFDGEVKIIDSEEILLEADSKKRVKCLLKKKKADKLVVDLEDIKTSDAKKLDRLKNLDRNKIKEKAKRASSKKKVNKVVKTTYRERNPYVVEFTKDRASGICDLCNSKAPFKDKDDRAYLECHHVITLASGGSDVIYNTVALCPNCHKKVHILKDKNDFAYLKKKIKNYLILDNDVENLKEYEKLF